MPLKILLADDSMTAQSMGKRILTDAGYDVITVSNGAAAVRKFPEIKPDLALLDVYMPGYNGLEVCERIKSSPKTAHIPVLLTVGKLEPFTPEDGMRVKAEGVIVKPFEATDLLAVVSRLAERVQAAQPAPASYAPTSQRVPDYDPVDSYAPERHVEISSALVNMPAMDEELLESDTNAKAADQAIPHYAAQSGTPAHLEEFSIQLEPLPIDGHLDSEAEPWSHPPQSSELPQAVYPAETTGSDAQASSAIPIEFEIEYPEGQSSSDASLGLAPFVTELREEEEPQARGTSPEYAAASHSTPADTDASLVPPADHPRDAEDRPVIDLDALMGASEPADQSAAINDLDRVLQDALAASNDKDQPPASFPELPTAPAFEVNSAEAFAASPTDASEVNESGASPVEAGSSFPSATDSFIDLDSLLVDSAAEADSVPPVMAASEPTLPETEDAASANPLVASAEPDASTPNGIEFAVASGAVTQDPAPLVQRTSEETPHLDPDLAEQIAERVFQRLKPALIEEIRNALKEI